MNTLYGNIHQHIPRTNFKFKAVYPSRLAMALDEKNYWNYTDHKDKEDFNGAPPIHTIDINDYVLINYTIPKKDSINSIIDEIFTENQNDDLTNNNNFAYDLNENGEIEIKKGYYYDDKNNKCYTYDEYYQDLIEHGGTFAPGNYHMTVWQKQKFSDNENIKPSYVAIARLHSILPTFESWGSYHIDVLEPLSSYPDQFGIGKDQWFPSKIE